MVEMKIAFENETLSVSELERLGQGNSDGFQREIRAAWPACPPKVLEIDLSRTQLVDSFGLGALISLRHWAANDTGNGAVPVRLVNPPPAIQQLLELTRRHRTCEITKH